MCEGANDVSVLNLNGLVSSIRIFVPLDTGCAITTKEHELYCELVVKRVEKTYGCLCRCERLEIENAMVWLGRESVTPEVPELLEQIRVAVLEISRDVWAEHKFWSESESNQTFDLNGTLIQTVTLLASFLLLV